MTEVSKDLRNIFFPKIPPILKLEVGFFPSKKKSFSQIFQNTAYLSYLNFISVNFHKNQRTFFGSGRAGGRAGHYHSLRSLVVRGGVSQAGAPAFGTEHARLVVQVERLRCTRLRRRT